MTEGSPPRDASGKPINYVDPANSPELAGKWFAYRVDPTGAWRYAGIYDTEAEARAAVGLPPKKD
ncbi:MAG: hypothetical protein ACLQJR_05785 [Stellaceae bacterium]